MLFFLLAALASAGELVVATATPVIVKIDGTIVDYVPGTMMVQVSGMSGIHKVDVTSLRGELLQTMNVNIPQTGVAQLLFDGQSLALASAGVTGPATRVEVVAPAREPARPAEPAAPAAPTAMGAGPFANLVKAVKAGSFSDEQVGAVRSAAASNWFTIAQVGQLVDLVSFSDDKIAIVRACRPKVVDPENAFSLGSHFSFSSDKEAALSLFR